MAPADRQVFDYLSTAGWSGFTGPEATARFHPKGTLEDLRQAERASVSRCIATRPNRRELVRAKYLLRQK